MCGIAGFFERGGLREDAGDALRRMTDALRHRGPDDAGSWLDAEAGIALGHRRLSIVDLSPAGHQPMSSCGRWVISFNGEIYNHAAIREELVTAGASHEWRGHSDTEVLLAAIAAWGLGNALDRCVGMFAFALWDRREQTLTLARDRLGEKPLYYGWLGKQLVFASELVAFYRHPDWRGEIDPSAVALLMQHSCIPAPYSIFKDIFKLRPAHMLRLSGAQPDIACYWDAAQVAASGQAAGFSGSPEEAVEQLDGLLRQSLRGQMMADVPLGAFLSGGIDSSAIVAVMQSMSPRPVRTFTIGFNEAQYNEANYAKAVAAHLGTQHTELTVTSAQARDVIPQLPGIYSEPFADPSQIPTYLVSRLAKQSVTVSLSGDAGDELFSGYSRYAVASNIWHRLGRVPRPLRGGAARLLRSLSPNRWDALASAATRFLPARHRHRRIGDNLHKMAGVLDARGEAHLYRRLVSQWPEPTELVSGSDELATVLTGPQGTPEVGSFAQRMMYWDLVSYLPDDILVKVDRAAMAVGLETRVPLLDHRLVEFAWTLPLSILRRGGRSKWPLRQLLHRHLPPALIERPKMGFGVPIADWLRGPLRDWADALLAVKRLRDDGFFDACLIRDAWEDHTAGRRNLQYPLWNVLMFQAWIDSSPSVMARGASNTGKCAE